MAATQRYDAFMAIYYGSLGQPYPYHVRAQVKEARDAMFAASGVRGNFPQVFADVITSAMRREMLPDVLSTSTCADLHQKGKRIHAGRTLRSIREFGRGQFYCIIRLYSNFARLIFIPSRQNMLVRGYSCRNSCSKPADSNLLFCFQAFHELVAL